MKSKVICEKNSRYNFFIVLEISPTWDGGSLSFSVFGTIGSLDHLSFDTCAWISPLEEIFGSPPPDDGEKEAFLVDGEGGKFVHSKLHYNVLIVYTESVDQWFYHCFRLFM